MKKIIFLALFSVVLVSGCSLTGNGDKATLSLDEAKVKAADFINDYLMNPGQEVSIKEVVEENGLYKVVVNMTDGQEIDSYLTKDGETFFPSGIVINDFIEEAGGEGAGSEASQNNPEASLADIVKSDLPSVELFVMSHCPYGTQIVKGILPVVEALGEKIDFELKFVDYLMHGQKELDEQLIQYCIQKNTPEKLNEYLYCFLEEGDGKGCLSKTGINERTLKTCVDSADKEFKITESFNDRSTYRGNYPLFALHTEENQIYGVTGSPSLVINEQKISSGRDSASLLRTICAGFNEAPAECEQELSAASPSPGFGFGTDGSGAAAADCGI